MSFWKYFGALFSFHLSQNSSMRREISTWNEIDFKDSLKCNLIFTSFLQ